MTARLEMTVTVGCMFWLSLGLQGEFKAQKEAVWAVTNLTAGGNIQQV